MRSDLELEMRFLLKAQKLFNAAGGCVEEHRFHPIRKWRFDFAWPEVKVALEVEGLSLKPGESRHTSNKGFIDDCEKYSVAAADGWRVLRVTHHHIRSLQATSWLARALGVSPECEKVSMPRKQREAAVHG